MKRDHPEYGLVKVACTCGNKFETYSTRPGEMHIEVCSECHPFYTGKQKLVDTAGRVQKFRERFRARYSGDQSQGEASA